jgi:hypothetical protein
MWIIASERHLGDSHRIQTESVVYDLRRVQRSCCDHGKTARNTFIAVKLKRTTVAEINTDGKISTFAPSKPVYEYQFWCLECAKAALSAQGGTLDWLITGT